MLARWIVFALYLGAVLALGWLLVARLRKAWRLVTGPDGGRTRIRVYIFALLCALFSSPVAQVVAALVALATGVSVRVPFRLATDDRLTGRLVEGLGAADGVPTVVRFVADHLGHIVNESKIGEVPLGSIVLFLALFALAAMPVVHPSEQRADPRSNIWVQRITAVWHGIGPRRRQNFYLSVVLLGAGYLSIAALMAIPELESTRSIPESVSVEKLRAQLTGIQISSDELNRVFPENAQLQNDPFGELNAFLSQSPTTAPPEPDPEAAEPAPQPLATPKASTTAAIEPAAPPGPLRESVTPPLWSVTKQAINSSQGLRTKLAGQWRDLRTSAQVQQRYAFDLAVLTYENDNLNRVGVRQTTEHFRAVIDWYLSYVLWLREELTRCHGEVHQFDVRVQRWAQNTVEGLRPMFLPGGYDGVVGAPPEPSEDICALPSLYSEPVPRRDGAHKSLNGVFRAMSGWLVQPESLSLTLLIGMLGFALLGASVSPIVRSHEARVRAQPNNGEPLVRDLASLVIRGVSAAVVVFLGLKGGLSLLGSSDISPNPYALLLTCFAAAVYSERAWNSVRDWFGKKGEGDGSEQGQVPPPSPGLQGDGGERPGEVAPVQEAPVAEGRGPGQPVPPVSAGPL